MIADEKNNKNGGKQMTWSELMDKIEMEGNEEELEIMKPKMFTIAELAELLGVSPIRIYQLQKRKKNPLPICKSDESKRKNVWVIKEIPLLQWVEQEESKSDPRKKIDYSRVHEVFDEIFQKRDEIIEKYMDTVEEEEENKESEEY